MCLHFWSTKNSWWWSCWSGRWRRVVVCQMIFFGQARSRSCVCRNVRFVRRNCCFKNMQSSSFDQLRVIIIYRMITVVVACDQLRRIIVYRIVSLVVACVFEFRRLPMRLIIYSLDMRWSKSGVEGTCHVINILVIISLVVIIITHVNILLL